MLAPNREPMAVRSHVRRSTGPRMELSNDVVRAAARPCAQAQLRNRPRFARYHSNVLPRPLSREVFGVQPNAVRRDTSRSLRGAPSGLDVSNVSFPANPTVLPI